MKTEERIAQSLARGTKNLGALVYWKGLTNVRISRALWRQGLHVAGVEDAIGKDPKSETLLNQAVGAIVRSQGRGVERVRIELKSKGQEAVYRVKMPRHLPDGRSHDVEEAHIVIDCYASTPVPRVEVCPGVGPDTVRDEICQAVLDRYGELHSFVFTEEVSEGLVNVLSYLDAISLRTGVYFVHANNMDRLRAVQRFVESSTTARFTVWNVKEDDENTNEARRDARAAFTARLDEVIADVKEFTSKVSVADAETRSVNSKVKKFRELDALVELYTDVLGDYRDSLATAIAEARQTLLGAYLGESEDEAAA